MHALHAWRIRPWFKLCFFERLFAFIASKNFVQNETVLPFKNFFIYCQPSEFVSTCELSMQKCTLCLPNQCYFESLTRLTLTNFKFLFAFRET